MLNIKINDEKFVKELSFIKYIRDLTNNIKKMVTNLIYPGSRFEIAKPILSNSLLKNKSIKNLSIKYDEYSFLHSIKESKKLLATNLQEVKKQMYLSNDFNKEDLEKKSLLVLLWSKKFIAYGFSREQIMRIATSCDGAENFRLIDANHDQFFALKYSADTLAKVCSFSNGHNLLMYILSNGQVLNKLYDNPDQIIESLRLSKQIVASKVNQILTYNHSLQVKIFEDSSVITRSMHVNYQRLKQKQSGIKLDGNIIDNEVNVLNYKKLGCVR